MTHHIKVINKNKAEITDYFDGIAYTFPSQVPVNIPLDAATHIFGSEFPEDAKICASDEFRSKVFHFLQKRWGWNSSDPKKAAMAELSFRNISFIPVLMKTVEIVAGEDQGLAEPREEKSKTTKSAKFKPRLDGEGEGDVDEVEAEEEEEVA